jgi:hypothetical protein
LIHYFERHIEIDADEHGPMAMKMITELCGEDAQKMDRSQISVMALDKRIALGCYRRNHCNESRNGLFSFASNGANFSVFIIMIECLLLFTVMKTNIQS